MIIKKLIGLYYYLQILDEKIIPFNFPKEDQKDTIIDFSKKKPIMTNADELMQLKITTENLSTPLKKYYSYQILLNNLKKKYKTIISELPVFVYYSVRAYYTKDNMDYMRNTVWALYEREDHHWLKNCDDYTRIKYRRNKNKKSPLTAEYKKK